jgi:signal transduction histidine kinase
MRIFWILPLTALLLAGCAGDAPPPVSAISREWLEIKIAILKRTGDTGHVLTLLDDFSGSLAGFFASPTGRLYQKQPFDRAFRMESVAAAIGETVQALKNSARRGEQDTVFALVADIDAALARLQQMDSRAMDYVQTTYFRLFFFFAVLIIVIFLSLSLLYRRMENALSRERQSRSFSRETVMAQEQERSRIARELHDSVAQNLWRLSLDSGFIANVNTDDERKRRCAELVRGHQTLLEQIREMCDNLIPPDFRHQGLPTALRRLCHDFERRSGIECRIAIQENLRVDPLDPQTQLQCFRLVQEALANIEKHSGSGEAVVVARNDNAGVPVLRICVSDSGKGFAVPDSDYWRFTADGHFGIRNMYERAAIVNGTLTIDSESGEGVTVTLSIPLVSHEENFGDDGGGGGGCKLIKFF